ncbi:hypothetical protein P7B02_03245 [Caulobacter segnis]|uniref:hypothetical protein n=1 Tax=Caulobacter segnis TaxID=88688 RepID=UPI0024103B2F|nr:hypothetical protein [Caulobacter segnis]MDG2520546.1 hypothetical protein [Caulobacter segnis]
MGSWEVNPKPDDLWGGARAERPSAPPRGWLIENDTLVRDDSLAGYQARGQQVRASCYQRDCKRSCWIDIDFMVSRRMGRLSMAECKRLLKCGALGGCGLDFREEPQAGVTLRTLAAAGEKVRIAFRCAACGVAKATSPAAAIARLKAGKRGDEDTLHTDLGAKLTKPCKCGKTRWEVQVRWPDPNAPTHGGEAARAYDKRIRS